MGALNVTVPGSVPGDQFTPILFNASLAAAGLTSLSAVTLATTPSTGTYRVTVMANLTQVGTGSGTGLTTIAWNLISQDPNAAAGQTTTAVGTFSTDSANSDTGTLGKVALTSGAQSIVFRSLAGKAIQISTTYVVNGGLTTGPKVQVYAILESLGQ